MKNARHWVRLLSFFGLVMLAFGAEAQSFRVQCPASTSQHPSGVSGDGSAIKCQQIAGGDGYATMGDGQPIYLFGFGPLSGLRDMYRGMPGTQVNTTFNTTFGAGGTSGDTGSTPSNLVGMPDNTFAFNGAIGLTNDINVDPWTAGSTYLAGAIVRAPAGLYTAVNGGTAGATTPSCPSGTCSDGALTWSYTSSLLDGHVDPRAIMDVGVMNANAPAPLIAMDEDDELFLTLTNVGMIMRPDLFEQHTVHFHGYPNAASFYDGVPDASIAINIGGSFTYYYLAPDAGTYFWHCHIAPPEHLQMGMVGQLYVRPRQNRVPADGKTTLYSALYQWEASVTLSDPSTATTAAARSTAFAAYESVRKRCGYENNDPINGRPTDIMCTSPIPADQGVLPGGGSSSPATRAAAGGYAYNDGDGSTYYDVEYPLQIHGFDPNFHFVGMTFNPESFSDMKDKYFTLNGRSYPDTVGGHVCGDSTDTVAACASATSYNTVDGQTVVAGPMQTQSSDGTFHSSQPLPSVINIPANGKALLRISDLDVTEYQTLASLGIPMKVIGLNARLLRDMAGNNLAYNTNSITLAGGESIDVILDASGLTKGQKFYLYTPQLDHLSNDAENFGGLMTEVNICGSVDPTTKVCGT
ncbi:MAG: Multicopper oxidase, type 3 [Gammaproteobacteria bacterium]|nr:Multicopper oxidase, type 3 [Gammaproteobacteria bacterium]